MIARPTKTNVASQRATMMMPRVYPAIESQAIRPPVSMRGASFFGIQPINQPQIVCGDSMKKMTPKMKTDPAMMSVPMDPKAPRASPSTPEATCLPAVPACVRRSLTRVSLI